MRASMPSRFGHDDELGVRQAALRGAAAGVVGGTAVLLLSWLIHRGFVSAEDTLDEEWERVIRKVARRGHIELSARQLRLARMTAQLTYAALVGAAYGVARTRRALPTPLRAMLNSGLVHAASVPVITGLAPKGGRRRKGQPKRKRSKAAAKGLSLPVGSAALYGLTTSAAFTAFQRV
jgi:hypothetical protein